MWDKYYICSTQMNTMKTNFKSVIELLDYYKDEATCKALLEQQRWNGKVTCPFCGSEKVYRIENGKRFKCGNPDCYKKFSVTVGTIFENTKIELRYWYGAIYLATAHKKGISSHQLSRDLGISQKTAWFILHRVRHMLKDKAPHVLSNTVEIDETYIGGKEGNKHAHKRLPKHLSKGTNGKTPVLALVERGGKVVAKPVLDGVDKETLYPVMLDHVKQGSKVYTDALITYRSLKDFFQHDYVNHHYGQYVYGDVHTNTVEGYFSLLKRGIIGIYHQVSVKHLAKYCVEFSYRYNSRNLTDVERFQHVLTHAEGRLKWNELIAE